MLGLSQGSPLFLTGSAPCHLCLCGLPCMELVTLNLPPASGTDGAVRGRSLAGSAKRGILSPFLLCWDFYKRSKKLGQEDVLEATHGMLQSRAQVQKPQPGKGQALA